MKRIIMYMLLYVVTFTSCSKDQSEPISGAVFCKTFISSFTWTESIRCQYNYQVNAILVSPYGIEESFTQRFDELCQHYGDTYYNTWTVPFSNRAIADEFQSVDIICNIDFDQEHPHGTSLRDITMLYASTALPYIKSGYTKSFNWYQDKPSEFIGGAFNAGFHPIMKLLCDIKPNDLTIIAPGLMLKFTKPRPAGTQTYTITFKTKDKTLQTSITME